MTLLSDAISSLGAVLLPVAAGLLFEELTFGGLVRLMLAPWPGTRKQNRPGERSSSPGHTGKKQNYQMGEEKCSH